MHTVDPQFSCKHCENKIKNQLIFKSMRGIIQKKSHLQAKTMIKDTQEKIFLQTMRGFILEKGHFLVNIV